MSAVYLTVEGSTPDASDATFATGACQHGSGVGVEFESADAMVQHLRRLPGPFVTFDGTRYGWRVLAKSVTQAEDAAWCKCQAVHHGHKDFGLAFALEFGYETDLCSLCDAAPAPPTQLAMLAAVHAKSVAKGHLYRKPVSGTACAQVWMLPLVSGVRSSQCAVATYEQFPADQSWMATPPDLRLMWAWTTV